MSQTFWSGGSSWNAENGRRFNLFKSHYPDATFHHGEDGEDGEDGENFANIKNVQSWEEVKSILGIKKGANPTIAGVLIDPGDGTPRDLTEIVRIGGRAAGTKAESMEAMVTIAILTNVKSYDEFIKVMEDESKLQDLYKRTEGISDKDVKAILNAVEENHDYANHFIKIGQNALKHIKVKGSIDNYTALSKSHWDKLKKSVSIKILPKLSGDKWNPADILLVHKGAKVEDLVTGTVREINQKFDKAVDDKLVIPISVKKTKDAIQGARGIEGEIPKNFEKTSIKKYIGTKIEGVPVYAVVNGAEVVKESKTQRKVLSWIIDKGVRHVEYTAEIAIGLIDDSSVWYIVNDEEVTFKGRDKKKSLKLKEIAISLYSEAVWLFFDNAFLLARRKGGKNIQITADGIRKRYTKFDDVGDLIDKYSDVEALIESVSPATVMRSEFVTSDELAGYVDEYLDGNAERRYGLDVADGLSIFDDRFVKAGQDLDAELKPDLIASTLVNAPASSELFQLGYGLTGNRRHFDCIHKNQHIRKFYQPFERSRWGKFYRNCLDTKHKNLAPVQFLNENCVVSENVQYGTFECVEMVEQFRNYVEMLPDNLDGYDPLVVLDHLELFESLDSREFFKEVALQFVQSGNDFENFNISNIGYYNGNVVVMNV